MRWLKTTLPPNPNNKFRLENRKLHKIITSIEATTDPIENGKWDEASKTWLSPTDKVWIVDSKGQLRGQRMVWPTRRKPLPKGFAYIDIEPPKSRARKPIWNGSEWIQPRVVAVIVDNTIKSAGIENPRDDIENVNDVTNDDTRTEYPWPLLPSGEPARIGDTYNEATGEWVGFVTSETTAYDVDLTPAEWEAMLALTGLDDVRDGVLATLKSSDRKSYRKVVKSLNQRQFRFEILLGLLETFKAFMPKDADLSEERLSGIWLAEALADD